MWRMKGFKKLCMRCTKARLIHTDVFLTLASTLIPASFLFCWLLVEAVMETDGAFAPPAMHSTGRICTAGKFA